MNEISVESIVVENRFRKDMGDISKLKHSIESLGLLQPIGIDCNRKLVFGGRRLEAVKQLGWKVISAKVIDCDALIAEHDENEMHKAFLVSEQVAIAEAIADRLGKRQGQRTDLSTLRNISLSEDSGRTTDIAASKAGLGSGKTLEAAQVVIAKGAPELIDAMDANYVSIHAAKHIAELPKDEQAAINYADKKEVKNASNKVYMRKKIRTNNKVESEEPVKSKPDMKRLYEEGSSLSAWVLAHKATTAISQIGRLDPNAIAAIESIQDALNKQLNEITKG